MEGDRNKAPLLRRESDLRVSFRLRESDRQDKGRWKRLARSWNLKKLQVSAAAKVDTTYTSKDLS